MHRYRSHTCGELRASDVGSDVRLSGWLHNRRNLGGILFLDLRDHYGIVQLVVRPEQTAVNEQLSSLSKESVIRVDGRVVARGAENVNPDLPTGEVEVEVGEVEVLGGAEQIPFTINADDGVNEEKRLEYRFLDLRRERMHRNIMLRSAVISSLRRRDDGPGLQRDGDAHPVRHLARGRPRLPGALPAAPGHLLRAAAGAAAVQAAADDRRLRPLLPDRALLPRRGRPRRPLARRVLPARRRDELRRAGGRLRRDREGHDRRLRGVRRRPARHLAVPAHPLPRGDAEVRLRQAGPAHLRSSSSTSADVFAGSGFKAFADKHVRALAVPDTADQPRKFFDQMGEFAVRSRAPRAWPGSASATRAR